MSEKLCNFAATYANKCNIDYNNIITLSEITIKNKNDMRRKEQLIDHGLIKLFLFALVMLTPFTLWAEDYPITVAGIQVTSDNAENVLNDDETPTVVFNALTNTLTLNGATIDMSETPGYCPIESSIANLTIHLIGYNSFTPNSDNYNGIRYSVGTTAGSLSFTTEDKNGYGSLMVNGIYSFTDFVSGYNVTNSFVTGAQTGWTKVENGDANSSYKSVEISYVEYYNVWIGGVQLSSVNLSPVSGGTVYIPSTHTLHLAGYGYDDEIKSGLPELIVEVSGTYNTLSSLKFQPTDAVTSGTLTIKKDSDPYINTCKLTLSNAESGVITNFSSVTIKDPMKLVTPSTTPTWDDDVHAAVISNEDEQFYGIIVGATQVTDFNAADVLGDGTVKYFPDSKTLLLNGADIVNPESFDLNAAITISTPSNLENVKLQGTNIIDANGLYAFYCSNETELGMTFSTDETPGQLVMKNGGDGIFFGNVSPEYDNNLVISLNTDANIILIAQGAIMSPGLSVYWPDQEYTISGSGTNIKYQDYMGHFAETSYTGKFTMATTGRYNVAITQTLTVDETSFNQTVGGNIYSVRNKPTFSVEAGTYNASQSVKIENLPDDLAASAGNYPQVWYYLGENTNDSIQYTSAAQVIAISESTKVCVYIIDEDSGKKMKSKVVESQYVIRQDPGLQFVQSEDPVEVVDWTMGGTDNPALPTLKNTNEVAVTYESSDPAVATVAADGTVTPVGVGSTTITATSAQTDAYTASTATYQLNVYKDLSHSSITIEVAEVTYNGAPLEPAVTVKDGETSIAEFVSVAYANNTNAALSTAETAPTVTVTATTGAEVNYYKGSAQKTFTITAMSLETVLINDIDDQTYTGEAITPTLMVTEGDKILILDTDYTVTYTDNVNAGTATATITGMGNYQGTKSKTFTITAKSLATGYTVSVDATQTYTYTGSAITPGVTVAPVGGGDALVLDTDYTVSYSNNVNAAKADDATAPTVTVTGKGNYTGTASATFNIVNRTLAANEVTFHNHWATYFSADGDVELPEGIGAFVATGVGDGVVTVSQIKIIPEGEAVLLNNNTPTPGTVVFDPEEDTNLMEHAFEEFEVDENSLIYGLFNGEMWRVTGTILVGKNYLLLPYEGPQAPRLTIVIDGEGSTTGVNDVRGKMAEAGGDYYDLSGRKLQQKPSKSGLYIQNGKKVVVNNK